MKRVLCIILAVFFGGTASAKYIVDSPQTDEAIILDVGDKKCLDFLFRRYRTDHCDRFFDENTVATESCGLGFDQKFEIIISESCKLFRDASGYHGYLYVDHFRVWIDEDYGAGESLYGWVPLAEVLDASDVLARIRTDGKATQNGVTRYLREVIDEASGWPAQALCGSPDGPPTDCTPFVLSSPRGELVGVRYGYEFGDFAPGVESGLEYDFLGTEHASKFLMQFISMLRAPPWQIETTESQVRSQKLMEGTPSEALVLSFRFIPGRRVSGFDPDYLEDMELRVEMRFEQAGIAVDSVVYVFVSRQNVSKSDSWTRAPEALLNAYVDNLRNLVNHAYNSAR